MLRKVCDVIGLKKSRAGCCESPNISLPIHLSRLSSGIQRSERTMVIAGAFAARHEEVILFGFLKVFLLFELFFNYFFF